MRKLLSFFLCFILSSQVYASFNLNRYSGAIDPVGGLKTFSVDKAHRESLNTVFGEKQVGIRSADIAAQFQYGFPASAASASTANGGSITINASMLVVSTGTSSNGTAAISNKKALRYLPGHEAYIYFTAIFTEGKANSYQRAGIFDSQNGFFIGYEGTDFCVTRRREASDTRTTINITKVFEDSSFDPTKGQVYRISFGYLGFAPIHYEVGLPDGGWTSLNEIRYPNSQTVTHITNTNLQPRAEVANTGNTSDITIKTGSFTAGVVNGGGKDPSVRRFSFVSPNITVSAGEDMLVTFRSKSSFNSKTNYIQSILSLLSIATDLSKSSTWEFVKNMSITNTPNWTDVNTLDSTVEYSIDATVTSDTGDIILPITLSKLDRLFAPGIDTEQIELFPGDTMTILVITPVGTTGTYDLGLRWKELF